MRRKTWARIMDDQINDPIDLLVTATLLPVGTVITLLLGRSAYFVGLAVFEVLVTVAALIRVLWLRMHRSR